MLLQKQANSAFMFIIYIACFFKYIPFDWNSNHGCLQKTKLRTLILFCIQWAYTTIYTIFQIVRFLQSLKMNNVPPRIYTNNVFWSLAFLLLCWSKIHLFIKREDILYFTNILLEERKRIAKQEALSDRKSVLNLVKYCKSVLSSNVGFNEAKHQLQNAKKATEECVSKSTDRWAAIVIILGTLFYVNNVIPHGLVILDAPCAPYYTSSVFFSCKWVGDRPMSYVSILPFVLHELWTCCDILTNLAFNWALIVLGCTWTQSIILRGKLTAAAADADSNCNRIVSSYRHAQILNGLINDIFSIYLQASSSIPVVAAGILYFATIRFTHLDLHIFLVFPACAFRCLFEFMTQLQAAGELNQESEQYLTNVKQLAATASAGEFGNIESGKYISKFRKSCWKLTVSAGALYTLEKTIVLVSLSHCIDLTFNLLVAYPKVGEDNWGQN